MNKTITLTLLLIFCIFLTSCVQSKKSIVQAPKIKNNQVEDQVKTNDNSNEIKIFVIKNDGIYWTDRTSRDEIKIDKADKDTFKVISTGINKDYAKDKNNVYLIANFYKWFDLITFEDADPNTFQPLENDYAKDISHVYFGGNIIEGAEAKSFEILPKFYAKDKNHIYHFDMVIEGANPETFQVIDEIYSKDKDNVFMYESLGPGWIEIKKIKDADPETFQSVDANYSSGPIYAKDKGSVYARGVKIENADSKTFEVLAYDYSKDKNNAYVSGAKLENIDSNTFEVLGVYKIRDKNGIYDLERITNPEGSGILGVKIVKQESNIEN